MKKLLVFFILLISICLISCNNGSVQTDSNSAPTEKAVVQLPAAAESNTAPGDVAPNRFSSEEDFIKGLKDGRVYSQYHPENIKYYYRPKTLPEGASLLFVEANYDYVVLMYTFDKTKPDDISKQIMYMTYRGYTTDDYINFLIKNNEKEFNLEGKTMDSRYFSLVDFNTAKSEFNSLKGNENNNINPTPQAWTMNFIQNGDCFAGNVPFNIDEKDITKYFDMEKVTVQ